MAKFTWDHIHLRTTDPEAMAQWFERMLGAEVVRTMQGGAPRIDLKLGGANIFIAPVKAGDGVNTPPTTPYRGLDHFGLQVNGIDAIAADLGIEEVHAEVLPEHKASVVEELRRSGRRVAMVGDGVNDAPALAGADAGIAIGAGTDVAIESAGVVLASDDPRGVLSVVRLSKASYRKMLQNLAWATGYNVVAIPLAAGAFAWAGILPSPAVGAIFMSVSTIVVALNAQLLRRVDLRPGERN